MEWGLLLAIVGFAALVQLAFFWYYMRLGQRNDSVYPQATGESGEPAVAGHRGASTPASRDGGEPTLTCSQCGFENGWDPLFTYCGNCVAKLGR